MVLTGISKLTGEIELITGLHWVRKQRNAYRGTDNPVIKHPVTQQAYSRLFHQGQDPAFWNGSWEWLAKPREPHWVSRTLPAFQEISKRKPEHPSTVWRSAGRRRGGFTGERNRSTRLSFRDCPLTQAWVDEMRQRNLLLTETKTENMIDRIGGEAKNPRSTERVPAGARFEFRLSIRIHDNENLMPTVYEGLRLLELTGLGGSGSRGYGKLKFVKLELDGRDVLPELANSNISG